MVSFPIALPKVGSGVRQGSVLSPAIFNVFVNVFILKVHELDKGCSINNTFMDCIMYADDLILLSGSVNGLQAMITQCFDVSLELGLKFNCSKSNCIAFGPLYNAHIDSMTIGTDVVNWTTEFKYLGITFKAGKNTSVDISCIKRKFYASVNCILSSSCMQSQLTQLYLQEAYCLPVLLYATEALRLSKSQTSELNACWNSVFRRIFGFNGIMS